MSAELQERVLNSFEKQFGGLPTSIVSAPARVNLIGEHTDYNDGFVLPCAIEFSTLIAIRLRSDQKIRVVATDFGDAMDEFELAGATQAIFHAEKGLEWANYVRGQLQILKQAGYALQGAELSIAGNVPLGAGLSSSAALEVAVIEAFDQALGLKIEPARKAKLAQQAENEFVGCRCGIMDQLISTSGQAGHAMLIDCRSLALTACPIPANSRILIAHSRIARGLVDSEYNQRRQQCEQAAAHFGASHLRDVSLDQLLAARGQLSDVVFRRARHVITENERTVQAHAALQAGDLTRMGQLMAQSHTSMRDDFEITTPAIDQLVQLMQEAIGSQGGARMTGGGFGGCCVVLVSLERLKALRQAIESKYRSPEGLPAHIWVSQACEGAKKISMY